MQVRLHLQHDAKPGIRVYDLVWCQWMLMYVSDEDTVEFLRMFGKMLTTDPRGIIVALLRFCTRMLT